MNLYIDIGNSRLKWACGETGIESSMAMSYAAESLSQQLQDEWANLSAPENIVVANVAGDQVAQSLSRFCKQQWSLQPLFLSVEKQSHGVTNAYVDIRQLGIDRWLAIIAAWTLAQADICVVSCGTAVTIDMVQSDGIHIGGYIVPGTDMMQQALIANTHGIQAEEEHRPGKPGPGRTTSECLRYGAFTAIAALIDRTLQDYRKTCDSEVQCILTGGNAETIMTFIQSPCVFQPNLVLQGIHLLAGNNK